MSEINFTGFLSAIKTIRMRIWKIDQTLKGQNPDKRLARELLADLLYNVETLQKTLERVTKNE